MSNLLPAEKGAVIFREIEDKLPAHTEHFFLQITRGELDEIYSCMRKISAFFQAVTEYEKREMD